MTEPPTEAHPSSSDLSGSDQRESGASPCTGSLCAGAASLVDTLFCLLALSLLWVAGNRAVEIAEGHGLVLGSIVTMVFVLMISDSVYPLLTGSTVVGHYLARGTTTVQLALSQSASQLET